MFFPEPARSSPRSGYLRGVAVAQQDDDTNTGVPSQFILVLSLCSVASGRRRDLPRVPASRLRIGDRQLSEGLRRSSCATQPLNSEHLINLGDVTIPHCCDGPAESLADPPAVPGSCGRNS